MAKKLTCLVLAAVLSFAFAAAALAENTLNLMFVMPFDAGYLRVIAGTDYTTDADMSFSAYTENGELEITDSVVMRNEGTSWFVVLEYGNYANNSSHQATAERALKKISEMVGDKDEGAIVRCDTEHAVVLEKAPNFRDNLNKVPNRTDAAELSATVKGVMNYINENQDKLMPNVVVIIITACPADKVNDAMISEIGSTLSDNRYITTHIVVTAGETVFPKDRESGQKLIDKAQLTVGGIGYMTSILKDEEADKAIQRISDAERRKVLMLLDPKTAASLGKKLTIVQKTSGGKELKDEVQLSDALYTLWEEGIKSRTPEAQAPTSVTAGRPSTSSYVGGMVITGYNTGETASQGLSTELIIGIIVGAVVLALLIILLVLRGRKGGKANKTAAPVYTTASSGGSSGGTTVTLAGANGQVLKGKIRNGQLTVGRNGAKAAISVPADGKLSGLHATFSLQGNRLMITDNGSTNGTKVNGTKLSAGVPTELQQNDRVTLGSTTYTVSWR